MLVASQAASRAETRMHEKFMRRAIALAANNPKAPFGALLVDQNNGTVMSEGWNRSGENPTWHGEIDAINQCAARHPGVKWGELILYTTAEPCPMCQSAAEWAGIGMVVFGSSIPFLESLHWSQIDIRAEEVARRTACRRCTVIGGVLEPDCDALFRRAAKL